MILLVKKLLVIFEKIEANVEFLYSKKIKVNNKYQTNHNFPI